MRVCVYIYFRMALNIVYIINSKNNLLFWSCHVRELYDKKKRSFFRTCNVCSILSNSNILYIP